MNDKILRLPGVLEMVGVKKTTIYEWVKLDLFPRPVRLGARAVGWLESDVSAWLATRKPIGADF
ncbi:helix-turn-helix transcriptional regulator [Paraburkholderia sp. SIMBA_030]|uniref:helix-turn-helix transcriptional regulator n=1 Tax=Paraburkholderia sp. SIMBA_030 TaxID=3085773 RepID=UPI00397C2A28